MKEVNTYCRRATDLKLGESGVIDRFESDELSAKFLEIGCLPDSPIKLVRKGPAGRTMYMRINGTAYALRQDEANQVILKY